MKTLESPGEAAGLIKAKRAGAMICTSSLLDRERL
jgi:hypothetical protein